MAKIDEKELLKIVDKTIFINGESYTLTKNENKTFNQKQMKEIKKIQESISNLEDDCHATNLDLEIFPGLTIAGEFYLDRAKKEVYCNVAEFQFFSNTSDKILDNVKESMMSILNAGISEETNPDYDSFEDITINLDRFILESVALQRLRRKLETIKKTIQKFVKDNKMTHEDVEKCVWERIER